MTKQNCTSGTRTTKEKRKPLTRALWVGGSSVFYKEKEQQNPAFPSPTWAQCLPLTLPTLGGHHHV